MRICTLLSLILVGLRNMWIMYVVKLHLDVDLHARLVLIYLIKNVGKTYSSVRVICTWLSLVWVKCVGNGLHCIPYLHFDQKYQCQRHPCTFQSNFITLLTHMCLQKSTSVIFTYVCVYLDHTTFKNSIFYNFF